MAVVIQTLSDSSQARKDLNDLRNSVLNIQQTTKGFADKLSRIGSAIAVGAGVTGAAMGIIRLSDAYAKLQNGLDGVTASAKASKDALNAIYDISLMTRTSLDATAKLYTKMTMASKDLGASQPQIAQVVKTINEGFKISTASPTEAASAIQQLSQAFASGKLAGDEFNSVLENAPFLAREIAAGMGKTIGELYKMRDAGELFARDVFGAILKRQEQVNQKFRKMRVTFGDAFTNMGNSLTMLFNSLSDAFLGADGGGFATMINNWALGIADFARNFSFYLLKAKTTAIVFVIDVTEFFLDMWKRIVEDGPQAIVDMFKEFVAYMAGGSSTIGAYAKQLHNSMVEYVTTFYNASSAMFFGFLAWLRKSEATAGLADTLARMNTALLASARTLIDTFQRIDFKTIFERAVKGLQNIWERLTAIDWSKMFSGLGSAVRQAFDSLANVDVNKFFPMLSQALETVKRWSEKVVWYFWWIYDEVIGHSYIPDLIEGILAWTSKLMGGPLGFFKKFALGATAALSSISFKGGLGKISSGIGLLTKAGLIGGAAVGGAYLFKDQLGLSGVFDEYGPKLVKPMSDIVNRFDASVKKLTGFSLVDKMQELKSWWTGNLAVTKQDPLTGKVSQFDTKRKAFMDKLHIPRNMQTGLAVGLAGAITLAMQLGMQNGTTKTVVMGLFTTLAGVGIARGIEKSVSSDFFLGIFTKVIPGINKLFEALLGDKVMKDPFGFVALIAKLSLIFKAGRDYFLAMLKGIALAPMRAGTQVANVAAAGGLGFELKRAEKSLASSTSRIANQIATTGRSFTNAMATVERRLGSTGARDAVNRAAGSSAALRAAAPDVRAAAQLQRLQGNLVGQQDQIKATGTARVDTAKAALNAQKEANAKAIAAAKQGARDFGASVGAAVGAGIGLSLQSKVSDYLVNSRKGNAVENLTRNENVTMNGQTLNAGQAAKVASGEIKIEDLDAASRKFAEGIIKGMEVPKYQQLAAQFGTVAITSFAGSAIGAIAMGLGTAIVGALLSPVVKLAWAAMRIAGDAVAWVAFRIQYYAIVWGTLAIQRTIAITSALAGLAASRAGMIATGVASGLATATAFVMGTAAFPFIVGAAIVAAVVGAAYLIYKYWDEIKAVGKVVGELLYKAIMDPFGFWKDDFPKIVGNAFEAAAKMLTGWMDRFKKWWEDKPEATIAPGTDPLAAATSTTPQKKFAVGGRVHGPGTGTSDSIIAAISNGEYIVKASQAGRHLPLLEAINNGKLPQFAKGGQVGDEIVVKGNKNRGGGQVDYISIKIGEAQASRAEAVRARGKASVSSQRAAADRLVGQWDDWLANAASSKSLLDQPYSTELSGKGIETEEKKKKKKKKSKDAKERVDFTFDEELDKINEFFPNLKLSMDEFLNLSDSARGSLFDTIAPMYNTQKLLGELPAGSGQAFDLANQLKERIEDAKADIQNIAEFGRSTFGKMSGGLSEVGLDISESSFQTFGPEFTQELQVYIDKQRAWAKTIKDNPLNDVLIRDTRRAMNAASEAMQQSLDEQSKLSSKSLFTRSSVKFDRAGISIDKSAFNRLSDDAIARINGLVDGIIELQKKIEDGTLTGIGRMSAQKDIDTKMESIDRLTTKPEDRAKAAGENFAESMRTGFAEGLSNFLRSGKLKPMALLERFTGGLIDTWVNGLSENLLGKKSKMGGVFTSIGASAAGGSIFNSGAPGGLADILSQPQGYGGPLPSNDNRKGGLFGGIGRAFGGLFGGGKDSVGTGVANVLTDTAPVVGADISGGILQFAPKIGEDMGKSLGATVGKAGGGSVSAGAAGAAGSLVGMLFGSLFNEGGPVRGPGTSTSDSIPARLSNGEFVIRAKQVQKYRPLINAINDDTVAKFADGGLVGSIRNEPIAATAGIQGNTSVVSNKQDISLAITGDISRQTRREVFGLIPQIAAGINQYNTEKGNR